MFYGDLADLPISDVLGGIERRRGTLIVTTSSARIEIYLDHGSVCNLIVNGCEVTRVYLVSKLLAKLLGVQKGDFWFASNDIRHERYRLPLPRLMIEALEALPDSALSTPPAAS